MSIITDKFNFGDSLDKESFIIKKMKNSYIGDDGAVVGEWVYSKDLFIENTHFKKQWMSYRQIAEKAMLVNISDAISMNAKPKYALIGVVLPPNITKKEIEVFVYSLKKIAKKYGVKIIGGDTTSGKKIAVSITIISKKRKYTLRRKGLKKGDFLAFTGDIGNSKRDLEKLLLGRKIDKNSKFYKPILRDKFIKKATKYLSCGLDISDGLSKDLSRLCDKNSLGVEFLKKLSQNEFCSGEEYEMLFGFSKKNREKILKIAKKTDTKITIFAKAKKGRYKCICKEHHFKGKK